MVLPASRINRLPNQFFAALTASAHKMSVEGHDIINLGQGNPDLATPSHIVEALREAAHDPSNHRYPPFRGLAELREAICGFYLREYGGTLDPDREVAVLFGGKTGLVEISQCLLNPGDVALVPDPGYPDYWSGVALANASMHFMPLKESNGFLPRYEDIPEEICGRAKLMFLNYPNNPTCAVADSDFFERTVSFARQHGIVVAHDFAYGAIGFDRKPTSFLQSSGAKEVGVEFYTLSKTYNMAGWRVAFALGNPDVIGLINLLQDHLYVSLFGAVQKAAIAALSGDQSCVNELLNIYRRRRDGFLSVLTAGHYPTIPVPGSFFVWLPVPAGFSSSSFAELLLQRHHVVVAPGIGFGQAGDGYVRVAMLESEERLNLAARRIVLAASGR